jgi:hypothetical protein
MNTKESLSIREASWDSCVACRNHSCFILLDIYQLHMHIALGIPIRCISSSSGHFAT